MRYGNCKYCKKPLVPKGVESSHGKVVLYCPECEMADRIMTKEDFVNQSTTMNSFKEFGRASGKLGE